MIEKKILNIYTEKIAQEGEQGLFENLEKKIGHLLIKYQELKNERDELVMKLDGEKEKMVRLEKKLGLLSQDRERVKTRIDQLLHRLKGISM